MELKDRIREAMEGAGLKKLEFAKATKRSSGAITQWLDGSTKALKAETAQQIERVTGYSARWIVSGRGDKMASATTGHSTLALALADAFDELPNDDIIRAQIFTQAFQLILEYEHQKTAPVVAAPDVVAEPAKQT